MRFVFISILLTFSTAMAEVPAKGFGPASMRNQFLLSSAHLSSAPASPRVLDKDEIGLDLGFSATNTSISREEISVDGEQREFRPSLRFGLSDRLEVGVEIPLIYRGGGVLDSVIHDWHQAFGLPQGSRDQVPEDQYTIFAEKDDGTTAQLDQTGVDWGNPIIGLRYAILDGSSGPATTIRAEVSLPAGSTEFAHDSADFHLGVLSAQRSENFTLYGGLSWIYYGDTTEKEFVYKQNHLEGFVMLEYLYDDFLAPYLGIWSSSKVLDNLDAGLEYASYLDLGLTTRLIPGRAFLKLLLREDLGPKDGTSDVSFHLSLQTII